MSLMFGVIKDVFDGEQAQTDFIVQVVGRLTRGQEINLHLLGWAGCTI